MNTNNMMNTVFPLSISQQQQFILSPALQYQYQQQQQQQQQYLSYLVDPVSLSFSQQYWQLEIEKAELEMFIQQCDQQLLFHSIMSDGMDDDDSYFDEEDEEDEDDDSYVDEEEDEDDDNFVYEADVDEVEDEIERSDDDNNKRRRESQATRVVRRSKRIRLYKQSTVKFTAGAAMTTEEVRVRLFELKLITAEQFASSDLNIRFAQESDWSARSKNELQQQVLHQCRYGMLARWVLQDDGSRMLEIVRCSGIEGHHIESRSSWAHPGNRMGNHRLNVLGPFKKDTFYEAKRWLVKTCTRDRAGPPDNAPWVNGIQQNVEYLMATSNGTTQSTFGRPTHDAMNGELKLIWGPLQLNTQDAVDMVMDTPIINDGSDGKLVQIFINIEEPSKRKPMLHGTSNTTDPDTFMAAHHITLNGERTSDQSRALQEKIYSIQMKNYEKGLGKLAGISAQEAYANGYTKRTAEQHSADSSLGGKRGWNKSFGSFTVEQRQALSKYYCPPPTITNDEIQDLAIDDVVVQANCGTGTVISVLSPCPSGKGATARVKFDDEEVGSKPVCISSLSCNGKQCQFVKEYRLSASWDEMLVLFQQYHTREGHGNVPQRHVEAHENLGKWLSNQRTFKKQGTLDPARRQRLEEIGVVWKIYDASRRTPVGGK